MVFFFNSHDYAPINPCVIKSSINAFTLSANPVRVTVDVTKVVRVGVPVGAVHPVLLVETTWVAFKDKAPLKKLLVILKSPIVTVFEPFPVALKQNTFSLVAFWVPFVFAPKKQELFEIVRPVTPSEVKRPALEPKADENPPVVLAWSVPDPTAVEYTPVVLDKSALTPTAVELFPVVLLTSAPTPKADKPLPVVLAWSALTPTAVELFPVVLLCKAPTPKPAKLLPVVLAWSTPTPVIVFVPKLPPPLPIGIKL
jgi:hypothetical protein